jgi:putative nucleotidyltransferase with HDIG domain
MSSKDRRRRLVIGTEARDASASADRAFENPYFSVPGVTAALIASTIVLVGMIVDGGEKPFPYVMGQRVDRDLRLHQTIRQYNETKTRQKREENAAQANLAFQLREDRTRDLKTKLHDLLKAVGDKSFFGQVDQLVRAEWQLTPERFTALKQIVPNAGAVDAAMAKLSDVLQSTIELGVLDPAAVPPDPQRETVTVEIFGPAPDSPPRFARLEEVLLPELASPKGPLAKRLEFAFPKGGASLFGVIVPRLKPTLEYDADRSRQNREIRWNQVETVEDTINQGTLVVEQGQTINEDAYRLLREEHNLARQTSSWFKQPERLLGTTLVVAAAMLAAWALLRITHPKIADSPRHVAAACATVLTVVVLARLLRLPPFPLEILPVAVASIIWAVAYDRLGASIMAVVLSLFAALMHPHPMTSFMVIAGGTLAGVLSVNNVRSRTKLLKVGGIAAIAYGLMAVAAGAIENQPVGLTVRDALWRAGNGIAVGVIITGLLPLFEQLFGVVTALSLRELGDSNHPLLRELARRAPGTFNHSLTVSIFGEAAAKSIGADAEVVRVGALFHDVGKMNKPSYFIENKSAQERNRHEMLAPAMSTLVIIGHVRDGLDLGQQFHLPQPIMDLIEQHHGTTRVDYFYREAERITREDPHEDEEVEESSYRYPGPKPQSKEAAVIMLTDCVESASRTLSEPTPARIEKLVHELAMNRLLDGQFDESGVTLMEIRAIQDSLVKSVSAHYHGRVKYPSAAAAASEERSRQASA